MSDRSGGEARLVRSNVVWRRINERIEERLAVIERGIAGLLEGVLSPAALGTCRAEASLLSDWLFALDLVVAARVARDIVDHFDGTATLHEAATIATDVGRLRTVIRVAEEEWANVAPGSTRVHFISGANAQIDAIAWHLQQNGIDISYSPTFFSTPEDVDLVVVLSEHPSDALQVLQAVRQRSTTVVRTLIHPARTNPDELLSVASSLELTLRYEAAPIDSANQIMIALRPTQRAWSEAVLLGANELYPDLAQVGFTAVLADDAASVISKVESGSRIVVLGPEAPRRSELVRLLRSSPTTREAVIAASYASTNERDKLQRAGVNVTLPENPNPGTWPVQLRALAQALDRASGVIADESAPLPCGHRAWVLLERAISEVHRGRGKASLATITLPAGATPAQITSTHTALANEFRHDDTVAAIGERAVAVLLRGAEVDDAADRMDRALKNFGVTPASGMVGLAEFPGDGLGVKALVDVAINAAHRAAVHHGPNIVRPNWFPGMQQRVDVFIVESDRTLSKLLNRLVSNAGHTTRVVSTGSEALSALTGPDAITPPRLLVLELDAMGADGMMILRSLARDGIFDRSEVIVTCSLVNDSQLREAFELGAVDVVTKPFSSVVLQNRIARALAT